MWHLILQSLQTTDFVCSRTLFVKLRVVGEVWLGYFPLGPLFSHRCFPLCDDTALPESSFASVAEALHVQLIVKLDFSARPTPFQDPNTE